MDLHAQGVGDTGDLRSGVARADHAESLALQVDILAEAPATRLQLGGLEGRALGRREHQPDDVLRDVGGDLARLVADHHAALAGGLQVDHVRADGARGDEPQVGQLLQRLPVPLNRAPGVHDHTGALHPGKLLIHGLGPVGEHGHVAVGRQAVEVRRPLDLGRVVTGRHDLEDAGRPFGPPRCSNVAGLFARLCG